MYQVCNAEVMGPPWWDLIRPSVSYSGRERISKGSEGAQLADPTRLHGHGKSGVATGASGCRLSRTFYPV